MCGFALIFLIGYTLVCNNGTDNRALILTVNGIFHSTLTRNNINYIQ